MEMVSPDVYTIRFTKPALALVALLVRQGKYEDVAPILVDMENQARSQEFEATQAQIQREADAVERHLSDHPIVQAAEAAGLKVEGFSDPAPDAAAIAAANAEAAANVVQ